MRTIQQPLFTPETEWVMTDELPNLKGSKEIAINNVISQNALLNYSTSGQVRISLNLERDLIVLQNNTPESASKNYTYRLYNVRVTFASVPQIPKQLPIL